MKIFTIGFTQSGGAEEFFRSLELAKVKKILDVRLNNNSQLAGFTKRDDLRYFAKIHHIDYEHLPILTPSEEILKGFRRKAKPKSEFGRAWKEYESLFVGLMASRAIEKKLEKEKLIGGCLLCSEHQPHYCHRRLVLDYLSKYWEFEIEHIVTESQKKLLKSVNIFGCGT